jgi:hypothetical protein
MDEKDVFSSVTEITTFFDMEFNPFHIEDVIYLNVEELYPAEYSQYKEHFQLQLLNNNDELSNRFNLKKIKLIREEKYLNIKIAHKPKLTIDYYCEFI